MTVAQVADVLRATSLFAGLSDSQLERLLDVCQERSFGPGESIIEAGTSDDAGMWIILDGEAEVRMGDIPIHTFGAHDYFGELTLLLEEETARSADVVAVGSVIAVELRREDLMATLYASPEACMAMLAELARRLRHTTKRLEELELATRPHSDPVEANKLLLEEDAHFGSIVRDVITPSIELFGPGAKEG